MISKLLFYLRRAHSRQYISMSLSRGAATSSLRELDPTNPSSWEFSGFSQNGEDGIIDYLTRRIKNSNRYFIEIGSGNGLENNTSWLSIARKFSGLMIEGDRRASTWSQQTIPILNPGVQCVCMFLNKRNAHQLMRMAIHKNPDVLSIDIDGNDYYIAQIVMNSGFRPKVFVVEYNSTFGPSKSVSITYQEDFDYTIAHESHLYFGVSICGWKKFFAKYDYRFVTVESRGTNAFFIDPGEFDREFVSSLRGLDFQENFYHMAKIKASWAKRYSMIEHMDFVDVD